MGSNESIQRVGYFYSHYLAATSSLRAILSRPLGNLLTLSVIAIILTLPANMYLVAKNIQYAARQVSQPAAISAYLAEGTPEARIMLVKDQLESDEKVAQVDYISAEQGWQDLSAQSGFEQAISLLNTVELPAVLIVHPKLAESQAQTALLAQLRAMNEFVDLRVDQDWVQRFDAVSHLSQVLSVALSGLMLVAVLLIIGNTMRFSVLAHKEEIQVMKFLGATNTYILRPYLYTGFWFGLFGALIALSMTLVVSVTLEDTVQTVAVVYDSQFTLKGLGLDEAVLLLSAGGILGLFAAQASARRHLSEIEPS